MSGERAETETSQTSATTGSIQTSISTSSGPFLFTNTTTKNVISFLGIHSPYLLAITVFFLILIIIAVYLLYLRFCNSRRRFRSRVFSSHFFRSKDQSSYLTRVPGDEMSGPFLGNQLPPIAYTNKPLNLQPAANDVSSIHEEFRSIIASKLKKPPSTLETLIESNDKAAPVDVEIKEEMENDDVFNVISAKSLERYRMNKFKKADRPKKENFEMSETTESENVDKVIVLKSGSANDSSLKGKLSGLRSRSLSRRSKSRPSKTAIKKIG